MRHLILLPLLAVTIAQSVQAQAEDPRVVEAQALFDRGRALAAERRFSEATEMFQRSLELHAHPSTMFNLGACLYALGHHVEAIAMFERYLAEGDPVVEGSGFADAQRMLTHAQRSITELTLEVLPADARVSVDGALLDGGAVRTRRVNPGPHVVRAEAEGHAPLLIEIDASGDPIRRAVHLVSTRLPASLAVEAHDRPEARIRVDGREIGRGTATLELDAGSHTVALESPSAEPYERTVELAWNERLRLDVALRDRPTNVADEPALWIAIVSSAAAIAGGVIIGVFASGALSSPSGGSTGVVLSPRWSGREIP